MNKYRVQFFNSHGEMYHAEAPDKYTVTATNRDTAIAAAATIRAREQYVSTTYETIKVFQLVPPPPPAPIWKEI